ncbi:RNA exonuclease 5 isoform X4 [Rattus norvegicus]|uniref:RNA exonuclease 5 isoform X4 n=1 Tax=Rattus norvegicus TaxID=10116 RepID=UPI0003D0F6F4|nr:RNA exonuclease 5 isoform X6 [Rattus norvegicus]XP_008757978.1 RNA exonuclease 5 isoform X6 [Rattus norvegicus]XP_017444717.1 RNA exonuclease 5 isoform X6 [Rattus norvegicus]|eukprot:XP_008757977.1 PREDICTED: putative RNA exonuclease NEF-sp isoform X4 [Rattus norvegicus]
MELEEEENPRKRKETPNSALTTELDRPSWDVQDPEPQAKKARLSTILFTDNCEVTHRQLCELLKYAILGKSTLPKPSWCQLLHQKQLNNVVVFILKGMSQLHFYRFYLEFRFLRKTFRHKFSLPPPTSSFLFDIIGLQKKKSARGCPRTVEGPLISATLKSSIDLQNDPIIQKYGYKNVSLTRCLLTKEEMKTFHFPLQGSPNCENFILLKYSGFITDSSPLFGLDCEVCLTSMGKELTRISLVAEGGYCLMDELVKPDFKILDYLTSFSGITKEILNPVTTKLKDVQKLLRELLPPDAVLVGHCLDLDLRVLKIIHPYVIDTSLLYIGKQGRRFKLTFLAKVILGKDIQCPNKLGHDGIEDARTALELVQYFLKYGPKKIAEFNLEALAANQEQGNKEGATHMRSVLECLDSMGQKLLFLTQDIDELSSYRNCQTVKCSSNKEVLEQARVEVPLFPFNIVQFSFRPFPPLFAEEMKNNAGLIQRSFYLCLPSMPTSVMKTRWTEMSTIYAGPFSKDCNVGSLKKVFSSLGPVQSITLVLETYRPYFSIQYELLEAAQLAIETMNGTILEGSCIRVHRLLTELTLECDTLVRELEQDSENQGTIYVAGIGETFKEHLLEQSNLFPDLEAVILPKELKSRKQKNYCFLKFKTFNSAQVALEVLKGKDWKLKGRNALTSRHLQAWLKNIHPEPSMPMGLRIVPPLLERHIFRTLKANHPKIVAWRWSRRIEKLYHSLSPGTFCLILLPGTKNTFGSHPGLGLMKIKEEEGGDTLL